jgi:hypothetical protein
MRELVFRGKKKANGEWMFGGVQRCGGDPGEKLFLVPYNFIPPITFVEIYPETFGEYTQLKDINSKRIFEGDVVRFYYDFPNVQVDWVEWKEGCYPAFDLGNSWFNCTNNLVKLLNDDTAKLEIIGNIHDQPLFANLEYIRTLSREYSREEAANHNET